MRSQSDEGNRLLKSLLDELLLTEVDISARELARRHPILRSPSAFTRNMKRRELIAEARSKQLALRKDGSSQQRLVDGGLRQQLLIERGRTCVMRSQLAALVASHVACVRTVWAHGGYRALSEFWVQYAAIGEVVGTLHAVPSSAEVAALNSLTEVILPKMPP